MEKILTGEFDLTNIHDYERPFYQALQRVSDPNKDIGTEILPAQARAYFTTMRENTVTGVTSGRHMGMYKALCTELDDKTTTENQGSILDGILTIMNLCNKNGLTISRYCCARDIMLQKKQNNFNINAMRVIKIFEADTNFLLKHIGRQAMRSIEKLDNGLSDMQHGFRKGKNTYHSTMSIITTINIFRQARTGFALVETDCKAAFDYCIPKIVKMSWLAKGVPPKTTKFIYNHQTQTRYDVTAGGLVSTHTYGGEDTLVTDKEEESRRKAT